MTDRPIVYPASIPQDIDILATNRNAMIALGRLAQAVMGTNVITDGLLCHQSAPASMAVLVDPGCILVNQTIEATTYGSLPLDTTPLVKIGINNAATSFALTAPGTSGQSIVYLIEAQFSELDRTPMALPYYNAAVPSQPFSGPANTGTPQNTVRAQIVALQLKTGTPATTGTQTTPSVDSGWIGLWTITVAAGVTSVTNGMIAQYATAPFLIYKLPDLSSRINAAVLRLKAPSGFTVYVATSGNDSNDGLTSGTAKATLQAAADLITHNYDIEDATVTVSVANGTYAAGVTLANVGNGTIRFLGNTTTPTACKISLPGAGSCFAVNSNAPTMIVSGFAVEAGVTGNSNGLWANGGGNILFDHVAFGAVTQSQISCQNGGSVALNYAAYPSGGPYTYAIYAGANTHFYGGISSALTQVTNATVAISNTPAFAAAFAFADSASLLIATGWNHSGTSVTGVRYLVSNGAYVQTSGGGANFFPGSIAGSSGWSGVTPTTQYVGYYG